MTAGRPCATVGGAGRGFDRGDRGRGDRFDRIGRIVERWRRRGRGRTEAVGEFAQDAGTRGPHETELRGLAAEQVFQKFKKGEKLSTEDLLTLQKAGLL